MLVLYSAYERVAPIAINTVAESLGCITSLLRLFCCLKVPPQVCFVCRAATTAGCMPTRQFHLQCVRALTECVRIHGGPD